MCDLQVHWVESQFRVFAPWLNVVDGRRVVVVGFRRVVDWLSANTTRRVGRAGAGEGLVSEFYPCAVGAFWFPHVEPFLCARIGGGRTGPRGRVPVLLSPGGAHGSEGRGTGAAPLFVL